MTQQANDYTDEVQDYKNEEFEENPDFLNDDDTTEKQLEEKEVTAETPEAAVTEQPVETTPETEEPENEEDHDKEDRRVPYNRFSEVNTAKKLAEEAREKAERENQELKLQLARLQGAAEATANQNNPKEPTFNLSQKYAEYNDALMLGEQEEAKKLLEEINNYNQEQVTKKAEEIASNKVNEILKQQQAQAEEKLIVQAAQEIITKAPYLSEDSPEYNQEAANDFWDFVSVYETRGTPRHQAFELASQKVIKLYGETATKEPATPSTKLTKEQIDAQMKRKEQIPPVKAGKGEKEISDVDYTKMTDEEFKKSPEPDFTKE